MFHFHDVDILLKLAACELLDDITELLAVEEDDLKVLSTAIYKIRGLGKKGTYPAHAISGAIRFCETHDVIPGVENTASAGALLALGDGMDPGEVILFSSALENPGSRVVTGDKRALRCLGSLGKDHEITRSLRGRVVCFEELLLRTYEKHGYDYLCQHAHRGAECEGTLRLVFRSGLATEHDEALAGIRSIWVALNRDTAGILVARAGKRVSAD